MCIKFGAILQEFLSQKVIISECAQQYLINQASTLNQYIKKMPQLSSYPSKSFHFRGIAAHEKWSTAAPRMLNTLVHRGALLIISVVAHCFSWDTVHS